MYPCHSCTPLEWTNDNQWVMLPCCLLHGECGLPINAMFIIIPPCSASLLGNRYIEIVPPKFQYPNTWVTPHLPTGKLKKMKKKHMAYHYCGNHFPHNVCCNHLKPLLVSFLAATAKGCLRPTWERLGLSNSKRDFGVHPLKQLIL